MGRKVEGEEAEAALVAALLTMKTRECSFLVRAVVVLLGGGAGNGGEENMRIFPPDIALCGLRGFGCCS